MPCSGVGLHPSLLSDRALTLLLSLPPGRFVFSLCFQDMRSALLKGQGWLDLFSGSRALPKELFFVFPSDVFPATGNLRLRRKHVKELARASPCWILCYDVNHGADEDLLHLGTQKEIFELIAAGCFRGVSAGPVCSSFSCAVTPA